MSSDTFGVKRMVFEKVGGELVVKLITIDGQERIFVRTKTIPDFENGDVLTLEFNDDWFSFEFVKDKEDGNNSD